MPELTKPKWLLLLVTCLCLLLPTTQASAEETTILTLTPWPGKPSAAPLDNAGRGHGMQRESLGVTIAAGAGVEVRVTNGVGPVRLSLMTDDHNLDVAASIPASGQWVEATALASSAVFVRPDAWASAPTIEFRVSGQHWATPSFSLGDDQAAFVAQWESDGSPFAIIDDESVTMLLPRVDLPKVGDMSWSDFNDLDHVIRSYRQLIRTYDTWHGLGGEGINANHAQRPFIRPDSSGWGLAYYLGGNYIGTNNESVTYYLDSPSSWLILHEVGHGYDGMMTSPGSAADMALGEVWNNVYAYLYQTQIMGATDSNWLNHNGKENGQALRDAARRAAGKAKFNELEVDDRLDVLTRIADLTGNDALANMSRQVRELAAIPGFRGWPTRTDLVVEHWGLFAGVNLIPWLDLHSLPVSQRVAELALDVHSDPMALPLGDVVPNSSEAARLAESLKLEGAGELVTSQQVADLGLKGSAKVVVDGETAAGVEGRYASLHRGNTEVARVPFVAGVADFGLVDAGALTLRLPQHAATKALGERQWVLVAAGEDTTLEATYEHTASTGGFGSTRITLMGIADGVFATVTHNPETGQITVSDTLVAPHSYFSDPYARVTITNGDEQLFQRTIVGDTSRDDAKLIDVAAPVGSRITIMHREAKDRLEVSDERTSAPRLDLQSSALETTWLVTEQGLVLEGNESTALDSWLELLETELDELQMLAGENPEARLEARASALQTVIDELPSGSREQALKDEYGPLLAKLLAPVVQEYAEAEPTPTTSEPAPSPTQTTAAPTPTTTTPTSTSTTTKPTATTTPTATTPAFDVYTTPGKHHFNGRDWFTSCEPYSMTQRCRTEIVATQIVLEGGKYVTRTDWMFNNLTYLPIQRNAWQGNPLGGYGEFSFDEEWTSDGRLWRTECDSPATGRGGCRSFIWGTVIQTDGRGGYENVDKWMFNNIVRFS